jgi:hypothetical protein
MIAAAPAQAALRAWLARADESAMRTHLKTCAVAGCVVLGEVGIAGLPPVYRLDVITDLATAGWDVQRPNAISNAGAAVGFASRRGDPVRGWAWDGKSMRVLTPPRGQPEAATYASDVNASGDVLGWIDSGGVATPGVWTGDGLSLLARLHAGESTSALGMNDVGDVVGADAGGGVLWRDGAPSRVAPVAGTDRAYPNAINNSGVMAGYGVSAEGARPARWVDGVGALLAVPPAPAGTSWIAFNVTDINERGDVIGASFSGTASGRGYLWREGAVVELSPPEASWPTLVVPQAINDAGWIVGVQSGVLDSWGSFLWIDGAMYDLKGLIEPGAGKVEFVTASGINDEGVIAGVARIGGEDVAVVLTPVPGPGATVTMAAALGVTAGRRRRR